MPNAALTSDSSDSDQPSLWLRLVEVLLIILVFFAMAGDPTPHQNEPYYLCRLKHFWNPAWCAGDFFLESADAHATFVWIFGWITKWLPLAATAWVGRLFVWTLLAWAWQRLSWRIVPRQLFSVLSAALWVVLIDRANLAGEWVVGGFESKCVAYVFVLLALYELASANWNRVWLLLGAASAFHVLVGGWSVVVCGGIWLIDWVMQAPWGVAGPGAFGDRRGNLAPNLPRPSPAALGVPPIRSMLPGLLAGGTLALLGIVPALRLTWHQPAELITEANRIYVFDRLPHHLAILTVPVDEVFHRLSRHGLLLVALAALVWANRPTGAARESPVVSSNAAALHRLTQFAWGAVILAATGLAIELAFWNEPSWAAVLLRYYWFRLTDIAVPLAVALNAASLIASAFAQGRRWAPWMLATAILVAAVPMIIVVRARFDNPVPPCDTSLASYEDWVDVCQWAADNTPADALFLTPRLGQSFKWRTGRREVATRKDIPQDARGIVEWSDRLHNIYYHEVDGLLVPVDSVADLGVEHAAEVAQEYDVDFILANREPVLKLPMEYANNTYVVYRIKH
jgi:hypothetical protein